MRAAGLRSVALLALLLITAPLVSSPQAVAARPAQFAWGENLGWINFAATEDELGVTDTRVTGYAWSEQFGWINLGPFKNTSGVTNTANGTLGGFAWSAVYGWIPMLGAYIDATGHIHGIAGSNTTQAGRINFDCAQCGVVTSWRPSSNKPRTPAGIEKVPQQPASPVVTAPNDPVTKFPTNVPSICNGVGCEKIPAVAASGWLCCLLLLILILLLLLLILWLLIRKRRRDADK